MRSLFWLLLLVAPASAFTLRRSPPPWRWPHAAVASGSRSRSISRSRSSRSRSCSSSSSSSSSSGSSAGSSEGSLDGKTPKVPFRPKQSLGQNYLSDQNYVLKICNALAGGGDAAGRAEAFAIAGDRRGARVVEVGPGAGALSRVLVDRHPGMLAIELDKRAVEQLTETLPQLTVRRCNRAGGYATRTCFARRAR